MRVITFGTFDLLHIGHINIFKRAKALGDTLIVGVSTDKLNFEKKNKYPVYNENDRAEIVRSIKYVDEVFFEHTLEEKRNYIIEHKADILVMGDDWKGKFDFVKEICENFISSNPKFNLKYYLEKQQGLSYARNRGIQEASHEIIAYIDDDAPAGKNYVRNLIQAFENNPGFHALGGKVEPIYETGFEPKWMSKYLFGIVSKVDYGEREREFPKKFPTGCNMAFKRNVLEKIGGFNTDIVYRGDEKYVFLKLKENNIKVLYAPNVFVKHFIEKFRVSSEHVDKISRSIGASEKLRLQSKTKKDRFKKNIEYLIKLGGSMILFVFFTLKGQYPKGKYAVKVMIEKLKGYYSKKDYAKL